MTGAPAGVPVVRLSAVVAILGLLALALAGCGSTSGISVVVTPVRSGTLAVSPGGSAPVIGAQETAVTVSRRGTVAALSVVPGQRVQAGQQVAVVRELGTPTEQQSLASQLEALQTLVVAQRQTYGASSPEVTDTLNRISAVRQQLSEVVGAPAVLSAPQSGVVAALDVATGSEVDTSKPLMMIVDMSTVRVTVPMAGEYSGVVHTGSTGQLILSGSGGRSVPATVTAIVPSTIQDGGFEVTATAVNRGALLTVGTSAYLKIDVSVPKAVQVPTRAVLGTTASPYVYVVSGTTANLRPLVVGASDGTWTQVVSGVKPGDRVVLTGNQNLTDDAAVHVTGEQAPS